MRRKAISALTGPESTLLTTRRTTILGGFASAFAATFPLGLTATAKDYDDLPLSFFRIGTGPSAETLYSLGAAISAGISRPPGSSPCDEGGICGVPGLIAVAQSRAGSIPNIRNIRDGVLDSALVHADIAYWGFTGGGPFAKEVGVPELRVIADLIPVSLHIVVRADSGITSIRDLRGKTVSLGPRGSGTFTFLSTLLRLNGLTLQDFHPLYLRPGPAADHLITGVLDAFFEMGAAPLDAIEELHQQREIRLLPVEAPALQTLRGFFPFLSAGIIAKDTYNEVEQVSTMSLDVNWVVRASMDATFIKDITRALWQSTTADLFNHNNPGHKFPTVQEGRPKGRVPIHPGAEAYYKSLNSGTGTDINSDPDPETG